MNYFQKRNVMLIKIFRFTKHCGGNLLRILFHSYLRACGIEIGKNTMISLGAKIDVRRGKIKIGNNCTITHGCVILSHDAAATLMGQASSSGSTIIENGVFIGVNSVVLPGITIGANSIIGAGSIVTHNIENNCVACGNPARVIKTLP